MVVFGRMLPRFHRDAGGNGVQREQALEDAEDEDINHHGVVENDTNRVVAPPAVLPFRSGTDEYPEGILSATMDPENESTSPDASEGDVELPFSTDRDPRSLPPRARGETRLEIVLGPIPGDDIQAFFRILVGAAVGEVLSKWGLDGASDKCEDAGQSKISGPASAANTGEAEGAVR
jgi:hypothetical protein